MADTSADKKEVITLEDAMNWKDPHTSRRLALSFVKKPQKPTESADDLHVRGVWQNRMAVLWYLHQDDSKVADVRSFLEQQKSPNKGNTNDKPYWDDSYRTLDRIPRYWLGEVIVKATHTGPEASRITAADLSKIDQKDPMAVRLMFEYFTALDTNAKIPKIGLQKCVLERAAVMRMKQVGNRWDGFRSAIALDGAVDWNKGAYSVAKVSDKIKITHRSTQEVADLPDFVRTDLASLNLQNNAHDGHAYFDLPGFPMKLADQFSPGKGPKHSDIMNVKGAAFEELCKQALQDITREEEAKKAAAAAAAAGALVPFEEEFEQNSRKRRAAAKRAPKKRARPDSIVVPITTTST